MNRRVYISSPKSIYKKKFHPNVGEDGVLDKDNAISCATSKVKLGEALQQLEKIFISCPSDYEVIGWMRTDKDSPHPTKRDKDFHNMMLSIRQKVQATSTLFCLIFQNENNMEFFEINQEHPSDTIPAKVVWSNTVLNLILVRRNNTYDSIWIIWVLLYFVC